MIKLTQTSETFGDCTALYLVELTKEYTVVEFIKEVLTKKEWGKIGVYDRDERFESSNCEYNGKELQTQMPEAFLNKKIDKVTARGGWSRMDYTLHILDFPEPPQSFRGKRDEVAAMLFKYMEKQHAKNMLKLIDELTGLKQ